MTTWKVKFIGNDKVLVNDTNIHTLDTFIQFVQDENKRKKERSLHFAYNGE
jgi:hypothetical protein